MHKAHWERSGIASSIFFNGFGHHFRLGTRDLIAQSKQYLSGLMQARKKNIKWMAEVVPDSVNAVLPDPQFPLFALIWGKSASVPRSLVTSAHRTGS